ncbi:MAG: hypothetical protein AB8B56_15505 [Crocinitomicaceae bacterium]
MRRTLTLLLILFTLPVSHAQNVRFSTGALDNGLTYPIADYSGHPEAKKALNENILEIVSRFKDQDYCISQYGFVQHNKFIQLNFYFNCIDLDESEKPSYLFNLTDGELCPPSSMFSEDLESSQSFFRKKISTHYAENGQEAPKEFIHNLTIDDCTVSLLEKGLEISIESQENWPDKNLLITWAELTPYLKHLQSR